MTSDKWPRSDILYCNWIDVNFVIKVADFGLAESMDSSKEYFRQGQENVAKLPIKWLALESIHDQVFSQKSDVVRTMHNIVIIIM